MSFIRFLPILSAALLATPAVGHAQQPASRLDSFFGRRSLLPAVADTTARAMTSTCPMPVARPDTSRLERMPRIRVDSLKMAPMPVAHGCVASAK